MTTLEEQVEGASKLASQWPKLHRCKGLDDEVMTIEKEIWDNWPIAAGYADDFGDHAARRCGACGHPIWATVRLEGES